jgi:hypothetical protein
MDGELGNATRRRQVNEKSGRKIGRLLPTTEKKPFILKH